MKKRIAISKRPTLFKRINAPYRVVFIDDESLEEVATFSLTKSRIYVVFSTLFVLIVIITVAILLFTPLKYYIPGYGSGQTHRQVIILKKTVDSLSDMVSTQHMYMENIRNVLMGDYNGPLDTTMLDLDKVKRDQINSILPDPKLIRKQALEEERKKKATQKRKP